MAYQVLALKWRPQQFDEVIGQEPVTRTLRNAVANTRIAHAFVFAGPRGSGKTTTARILAKALNCAHGPTPDPCGTCDACVEITQGRNMDVLEIDAASHTQVENIREVVLAGLAVTPVRDTYKVFIIDEVHQLSSHSFNALLKSIEEPPPHVVFMMATTEQNKIPDTILSRSQVFEFRTISARAITTHLRTIADAEALEASDAALALISRAAEGSMRDAQSALDQVMAFAGQTISVDEVSAVLGLVGRDLLFQLLEAVVAEDGPRAFALADRAVEAGHDLKLVCRELSRVVRDMMVLSVDPARAADGELADDEREQLMRLAADFSREDLMRAFELLSKAELDFRTASQPRYYFEMMLLRWMHLRKLVPLTEWMAQMGAGGLVKLTSAAPGSPATISAARPATPRATTAPRPRASGRTPTSVAARASASRLAKEAAPSTASGASPAAVPAEASVKAFGTAVEGGQLKNAFLAKVRSGKGFFYNTVVAQAQRIEVSVDAITFTFLPTHRALHDQFNETRSWLESAAERLAGRRMIVAAVMAAEGAASTAPASVVPPLAKEAAPSKGGATAARDLKAEAMSSSAVQAILEVFPAEISDVEEM
jgi:DNA polymerase-3 subunit gamma/tau